MLRSTPAAPASPVEPVRAAVLHDCTTARRDPDTARGRRRILAPMGRLRLDDVLPLLEAPSAAALAVYRADGSIRLSPVWYRWTGEAFEVVIAPGDGKLTHLESDRRVSLLQAESPPVNIWAETLAREVVSCPAAPRPRERWHLPRACTAHRMGAAHREPPATDQWRPPRRSRRSPARSGSRGRRTPPPASG